MIRTTLIFAMSLLVACSNSVENNVGALPNIEISGVVLNGNVRDASVQVVGIDNYGQPQRNADGELYADRYFTDDEGRYSLLINGAATGSLLFVVKAYNEDGHNTQIRCALTNGCRNEQGASVGYGDWYDVSADFELWAVVNDAQSISTVHVSPFTHLAAKLAFSDFQWNGAGGAFDEACTSSEAINNMFTPQSIHEANTRVQALFNASSNIHAFLEPFSPFFESSLDSVSAVDGAKHGLLNLTWQYQAREDDQTLNQVLTQWLDEAFLENCGQLYHEDTAGTPQWDLESALSNAILVQNEISSSNSAIESAIASFESIKNTLVAGQLTNERGGDYSDDLDEQVTAAREFVSNAQSWMVDYESKTFGNFLDADTAAEITAMETQWEAFQNTLGPELQSVFLPVVQLVDYALLCTANGSCATGESYDFSDADSDVAFNETDNSFTYTNDFSNTIIKGSLLNVGDTGLIKTFSFSEDVKVESDSGRAILQSRSDEKASITVYLESQLQSGVEPTITRIEFDLPQITLEAKETLGGSTYQDLVYTADDAVLVMQGVKDPTRTNMPIHFNLESLSLLGQVSNGSDVLDIDVTLNGNNASLHYPKTRFPDLDIVWSASDIKKYAQFDSTGLDDAQLAGWLALPSDVSLGETLSSAVTYNEVSQFSSLDSALKTELGSSSYNQFEFGELAYPGGATGLAIYKKNASDAQMVKQCNESDGAWSCSDEVALADLGCESPFSENAGYSNNASVADAFLFLKNNVDDNGVGCIPQVKIVGRGVYTINYGSITQFDDGDAFDVTLDAPHYLGLSSFNVRLLSRFRDGQDNLDETPVLLNLLGAFTDLDNVSIAFSVTHDFIGYGNTSSLGLLEVIPYGERTLWFAIGNSSESDQDTVIYYILDDAVSLVMTGFDYTTGDSYHDAPLGYIRYGGSLMGTLRKEGDLYVVRYIDGSWQLL